MSGETTNHRAGLAVVVVLALASVLAALPLAAHDFWIVPSSPRPQPGARVDIRLLVGEHLEGLYVMPRDPLHAERFALIGPAGEALVGGRTGAEPAGFVKIKKPGLYWVVYDSARTRIELPAERFELALRLEGLDQILYQRRQQGASAAPATEVFSRCAKALLRVGDGPGTGYDRALGLQLELVPEADPTTLAVGAELPVRLLWGGQPLSGALVVALHATSRDGKIAGRTGPDGRVRLRLPAAGFWLIKAVHMVPAPPGAGAQWESFWASLTFTMPAVAAAGKAG